MSRFFFPPPLDATAAAAANSHTLWDNLNTHLLVYQIFDLYICIVHIGLTLFIYPKKINYYLVCEN